MRGQRFGVAILGLVGLTMLFGGVTQARAGLIYTISQSGTDVVVSASGTLNLAGLSGPFGGSAGGFLDPSGETLAVGPPTVASTDVYGPISGPSFGPGGFVQANSGTGETFGFVTTGSTLLYLPPGYVSNSLLPVSTSTYSGQTFASLGLTPGTYTYTLPHDTIIVQVGPTATTVPEPSTFALFGLGGLALTGWRRWKRRQATA